MLLPAEIPNLQQDLGKSPKTQVSDLIQDQSDLVDLPRLSIKEIKAIPFAHLSAKRGYKSFSLSLQDLDQFLDRPGSNTPPLSDPILTPSISPSHYIPDSHLTRSENCQQENLFKMTQALSLARNTITEELEEYCRCKNVNPATLLPKRYHEILDVFSKKEADTLSIHRAYNHAINIKDGYQTPSAVMYGMSRDEIQELPQYLDENLAKGFICASRSYAASPVLFVKKPGGGLRFYVDYWGLNAVTIKNRYPLSLIRETLNRLCHAKIYTKLDIISAFNCLCIQEGDESLIAFCTRFSLFEYVVMPFGLCNGPASF